MKAILILVDEVYEELELWYPKIRLEEEGHKVQIAGAKVNHIYLGKHGYPCSADISIDAVNEKDFDGVVIPGGFAPDKLRRLPKVLQLIQEFDRKKKTIAFICHGGWVPISAKILKGKKVTSTRAIKDDMENAGAIWTDAALVIDQHLISSRTPADLPQFGKALEQAFK